MKPDPSEWLCVIALLLQHCSVSGSGNFQVLGPTKPFVIFAGEDAILPCHLSSRISAVGMEIRWFREDHSAPVCLHWRGKYDNEKQMAAYQNRTRLFPEEFRTGNVSLGLMAVRGSDDGRYRCLVQTDEWYEEALIDVVVKALGTLSTVSLHSEGGQTQLQCRSEGWYPAPTVMWTDSNGHNVTNQSKTTVESDGQGRLNVRSYFPLRQNSSVFCCLIRSTVPEPDWASQLHIAMDFFPYPCGWMVAFLLTTALSVVTGVVAVPLLLRQWRRMDKEENLWAFKGLLGKWVDVTLDPDVAYCELALSEDGKRVRRGKLREVPDNPRRFDSWCCTVSRESFTSGTHYWMVEVNGWCRIGVARESAQRKGKFAFTPQQGYWALGSFSSDFSALTDPVTPLPQSLQPSRMAVCVDLWRRRVSFYKVESRAHIYTFADIQFTEGDKLYPFFWTLDMNRDLVILPPVGSVD
ncbi:butyrophilin subfamily 1 member A1 [Amia ocellicauda]|uniref:butyrophilin subfamily 1 member A1 n=1 Tax=Amia ocellicauda TaxID=2972642 RepID=UPI003463925B